MTKDLLVNQWPEHKSEDISDINLEKYRAIIHEEESLIDQSTSKDLNIKEIFAKTNRCYSSIGSREYYDILHNPLMNKEDIKKRRQKIDFLKENGEIRKKYITIFDDLGFDRVVDPLDIIMFEYNVNKLGIFLSLSFLLGLIVSIVAYFITKDMSLLFLALLIFAIGNLVVTVQRNNSSTTMGKGIVSKFKVKRNEDSDMKSFLSLTRVISSGIKIEKINRSTEILDAYDENSMKKVKSFSSSVSAYNSAKTNPILSTVIDAFFLQFILYQMAVRGLTENKDDIKKFIAYVGKCDALLGMATYEKYLDINLVDFSIAKHVDEKCYMKAIEAKNVLVKNCVPNSIEINNNGLILTGSNMSGKSTFMRTLGQCILFSQCFGRTFSKEYEASIFKLRSTLVSSDDILSGKSYFMDEATGVLRLINGIEEDVSSFILIDEIFRGTNPIERISASSAIIDYIQSKNAICIVATHDKDIAYLSKGNFKEYYFDESVDNGKLKFDYKLKEGIAHSTNAIKLMKQIGYPIEIIDEALRLSSENTTLSDYRIIK